MQVVFAKIQMHYKCINYAIDSYRSGQYGGKR